MTGTLIIPQKLDTLIIEIFAVLNHYPVTTLAQHIHTRVIAMTNNGVGARDWTEFILIAPKS